MGEDNYLAELAALICAATAGAEGGRLVIEVDATSPPQALRKFLRCNARGQQSYYAADWLDTLAQKLRRFEAVAIVWQTSHVGAPCNDWVDRAADELAKSAEVVGIATEPCSFASVVFARPAQGLHAWASRWASQVSLGILQACCTATVWKRPGDLELPAVSDADEITLRAVRAHRAVVGDIKRHMGTWAAEAVRKLGCPHGCTGVRFDLFHAAFECQRCPAIVDARREYFAAVDGAMDALEQGSGVPHDELVLFRSQVRPKGRQVAGRTAAVVRPDDTTGVRRVLGGCLRSTGIVEADKCKRVLAAVQTMKSDGAKLVRAADESVREQEDAILAEARALHKVRPLAKHWLRRAWVGGPARAEALRRIAAARGRVVVLLERAQMIEGRCDGEVHALDRLEVMAAFLMEQARAQWPPLGGRCATEWLAARYAMRWRYLTMFRRSRMGKRVATNVAHDEIYGSLEAAAFAEVELRDDNAVIDRDMRVMHTLSFDVPSIGAGDAARRIRDVGIRGRSILCRLHWLRGGGLVQLRNERKKEKARLAKIASAEKAASINRARQALTQWLRCGKFRSQVMRGGRLMQGPADVRVTTVAHEARVRQSLWDVELNVWRWRRRQGRAREPQGGRARVPGKRAGGGIGKGGGKRWARSGAKDSDFHTGHSANGWQMWKVERILAVKRVAGPGRQLMVRIRWAGKWPDEWRAISDRLNATVRREARAMEARIFGGKDQEIRVQGARRSFGLMPSKRRRCVLLDEDEDDAIRGGRRPPRKVRTIQCGDSDGDSDGDDQTEW